MCVFEMFEILFLISGCARLFYHLGDAGQTWEVSSKIFWSFWKILMFRNCRQDIGKFAVPLVENYIIMNLIGSLLYIILIMSFCEFIKLWQFGMK